MIAQNLIRNDIKPLSAKENVQFAIELMDEFKVQHLPVVDKGVYIGVVSEDYLLDAETENLNIEPGNNGLVRSFLFAEKHLFDAIGYGIDNRHRSCVCSFSCRASLKMTQDNCISIPLHSSNCICIYIQYIVDNE